MVGPHAGWIVAAMADEQTARDWSMRQLVCDAVRKDVAVGHAEISIPASVPVADPDPALAGSVGVSRHAY